MPTVFLKYRPSCPRRVIERIQECLPEIVAVALTCEHPDGKLVADDVEVEPSLLGESNKSKYDIHITVEANHYPEREANLQERREYIQTGLARILGRSSTPTGWVWVRLSPGSWGKF